MRRSRKWGALLAACLAAAAIPPVLMLLVGGSLSARDMLRSFLYGCAYSFCIGPPAYLAMEYAACRLARARWAWRLAAMLILLVAVALAGTLAANVVLMAAGRFPPAVYWPFYRHSVRQALAITLGIGAVATVVATLRYRLEAAQRELHAQEQAGQRARHLATEARLSSLESRIHPHFLFNTLNSISALIREDPARAERTVERLAALLRYSLDSNARRLAPLRQELQIVADYLEIEKTRFGDRLRYSIEAAPELEDLEVPPLALQTLVENSVKHAVSTSRHGGEIRIAARMGAEHLLLEVSDDGPGFDAAAFPPGHGLENLQDRLAALYDGAGRLEVARRDGCTVVAVLVPRKKVLL